MIEVLASCTAEPRAVLRRGRRGQHVDDRELGRQQLRADRRAVLGILRDELFDRPRLGEQDRDDARRLDHAARADADQQVGLRRARRIARAA